MFSSAISSILAIASSCWVWRSAAVTRPGERLSHALRAGVRAGVSKPPAWSAARHLAGRPIYALAALGMGLQPCRRAARAIAGWHPAMGAEILTAPSSE